MQSCGCICGQVRYLQYRYAIPKMENDSMEVFPPLPHHYNYHPQLNICRRHAYTLMCATVLSSDTTRDWNYHAKDVIVLASDVLLNKHIQKKLN